MRLENLGRRAMFLIPSIKVYNRSLSKSRQSVAKTIHNFLIDTFGGYTCASGNIYGYFKSEHTEYDELREFRVALGADPSGLQGLYKLGEFLARLCDDIGEECIYMENGNEATLVYPGAFD